MKSNTVHIKDVGLLNSLIARCGFSQSSLSIKIGCDRSLIKIVLKRGTLSPGTAKKICEALNKPFEDIFFTNTSTKVD